MNNELPAASVGLAGQNFECLLRDFVLGIAPILRPGQEDHAGSREHSQVVYMTVGGIERTPARQPDDLVNVQIVNQRLLDLCVRRTHLAVGVQKALARRDQRALTVTLQCAALATIGARYRSRPSISRTLRATWSSQSQGK